MRLHFRPVVLPATLSAIALAAVTVAGQSAPAATPPAQAPAPAPAPPPGPPPLTPEQQAARAKIQEENRADHAQMMQQLGIKAVRPGRNANESQPNAANYDEAQANPYPKLPELMTLKSGAKVTTKAQWETRRKEIMEDFEREVVGRIPANVPKVTWTVAETVNTVVGSTPVVGRRLIGKVDNSAHPAIDVEHLAHPGAARQSGEAGAGHGDVPRRRASRSSGIAGARLLRPARSRRRDPARIRPARSS